MKFDKFMSISYRILCVILALFITVGSVCSCTSKSINASAAGEPDPASIIQMAWNYRGNYIHNMQVVESAFKHDLETGTIVATSDLARQIAGAVLYQKLLTLDNDLIIQDAAESLLYQEFADNWSNIPDNYTVSSTDSFAGYCKDKSGGYHYVMLLAQGDIIYQSDLFIIRVNDSSNSSSQVTVRKLEYNEDNGRVTIYFNPSSLSRPHFYDTLGYFTSDVTLSDSLLYIQAVPNDNSIPTIEPTWIARYLRSYSSGSPGYNMLGHAGNVSLSSETVNKSTPWTYYNDTMLPYIQQHYPDVYNSYSQYLVFPKGYVPEPLPDPTEPATFPNNGIYIDKQFNIGVNIIYPTDSSGQPVTDEQGETVTETAYITDTSPVDGEYNFNMPTLPRLNTYEATIPNPDFSGFTDGFSFIFTAVENIFTRSGFMPVIVACLSLGAIAFILWKIGG